MQHTQLYYVVVNHEQQYSVWFAERELPLGWTKVGEAADKETCLNNIKALWTDMRPASLRQNSD